MIRQDGDVQLIWDPAVPAGYVARASIPDSGHDTNSGPAGPAGVVVLEQDDASVSLCSMTGRVVAVRSPAAPNKAERELLSSVTSLDAAAMSAHEPVPLGVTRSEDRATLFRLGVLEHALSRGALTLSVLAEFLLCVELGVVRRALRGFPERTRGVMAAHAAADRLAERVEAELDQLVATTHDRTGLLRAINGLIDQIDENHHQCRSWTALVALRDGLGPAGADVPTEDRRADVEEDLVRRTGLKLAASEGEAVALPVFHAAFDDAGIELPEDAARRFRWRRIGTLMPARPDRGDEAQWWNLEFERDAGAPVKQPPWITVLDRGGVVIGAAQMGYRDERAVADIAVVGTPARITLGPHPFDVSGLVPAYAGYESADLISRIAHWAGVVGQTELSSRCFAAATLSWIDLGHLFRAAWAWTLSDQETVAQRLDSIDPDLVRALEAVVATGDIPDIGWDDTATPAFLWALDFEGLLQSAEERSTK